MKIKSLLFPAFMSFVFYSSMVSCTKETITTVVRTDTITTTYTLPNNLLTAKEWIYDSVYTNYTGVGTGKLVYVRGGSNNLIDYGGNSRFIFWANGTQDSFGSGGWNSFTWSYRSSDSTQLVIYNPRADYARVIRLKGNYLNLYDSTNGSLTFCTVK